MIQEQYYSIKEASKMLKVAYLTVYRWIKSGKLEAVKAGKQYRIEQRKIGNFLKTKK